VPLAQLPDEAKGRNLGKINLGQDNLGPSDDPTNALGDLTEAFDLGRLTGAKAPIPPGVATFSAEQIKKLPHLATPDYSKNGYTNGACAAIGVLPTDFKTLEDYKSGKPIDPYPADVNPRPTQSPGTPTSGGWTP
jgi:phospholipase C